MGGAREPSPLMETKCSSKRSPVPPSAWRELMPSARPPAPRSSRRPCKFEPYTLTRGAIEPHRIYGDKILVAQLKILE